MDITGAAVEDEAPEEPDQDAMDAFESLGVSTEDTSDADNDSAGADADEDDGADAGESDGDNDEGTDGDAEGDSGDGDGEGEGDAEGSDDDDLVAKRAQELGLDKDDDDKDSSRSGDQDDAGGGGAATRTPPAGAAPPAEPQPTVITESAASNLVGILGEDDLPETIKVGGEEYNLKRYAQDYPDDFNAIRIMGGAVAARIINRFVEGGVLAPGRALAAMQDRLDDLSFWLEADDASPGVRQVVRSQEFRDWLKAAPKLYQRLGKNLEKPEDAKLLRDAFDADQKKAKAKEHGKKLEKKRKRTVDLHSDRTSGGAADRGGQGAGDDISAFENFGS